MNKKKSKYDKLHLGSGNNTPKGWIHVDGSWSAKLAKHPLLQKNFRAFQLLPQNILDTPWSRDIVIHDLTQPLPFSNSSFSAIYSSHTLEHLYHQDAKCLLTECHRVMKKGGIIRIVVPDLESIALEYIGRSRYAKDNNKFAQETPGDRMQYRLMLRDHAQPKGRLLVKIYNTIKDYNTHKWMYDKQSLKKILKDTGFKNIRQRKYLASEIKNIKEIEKPERIIDGVGICIEATK